MIGKYYHTALLDYMFEFLITEDFVCGYVFPLCGDVPKYVRLELDDFVQDVLSDKPELIASDDYLDKLYERISEESNHGWVQADTYNVL